MVKDKLAGLLSFIFAKDKEENPMPFARSNDLLCKIKEFLHVDDTSNEIKSNDDSMKEKEN